MKHGKLIGLQTDAERLARVAVAAYDAATAPQTAPSGSISLDNADGTRTIIGPQAGSGEGAPSGQAIATHVGDTTPPPVPTGITAWSGDGSLHVMWDGTLSGDVPADFSHISILVDGEEVAQLSSAGSVTVGGVEAGATVSVTATAEDDACLADGTPAHNVSAPSAAVKVTIKDAVAEVRADADAHGEQIDAVKQDIAAYKASAQATYATKTEVDERTGAITRTLTADYTRTEDLASTEAVRDAKAAGTAAQASIDGMKLGGRNLLKGTSMESKAVTTPTTASKVWGAGFVFPYHAAIPYGAEYRCSADVLLPVDGTIVVDMNSYAKSGTGWGMGWAGNDNDNTSKRTSNAFNVKANVWTRLSWGSENTSDANTGKQTIYINDSVGLLPQSAAVTWHYRGLKVELGNKATDWTPAPEDTDSAVADAKKAGTDAQSALDAYKGTVSETYAEKTELQQQVNLMKSTMTANYSAFTDYRTSNDTALSKAQSDATNAQSTIDSYKASNDRAVADAKAAGTTAQDQLGAYKSSNDAAVAAARKAGTDAQSQLGSYKAATDQRLTELQNVADNAIESWYLKGAPTASNPPASSWTTDALRRQHAGDLYMDTDTGYSYRWSGTAWVQVKDSDVTKALKEIESVKTDYATKSELSATDTELSGKVSDALTTAKSYTDSSVEREVTARDAAIKAQADSISLDVSRTYTKSETFSAYQSDADGRIATANANASTAVSTAKTAASDAATAKTDASSAVSTANAASGTASKASTDAAAAVKTANAASSTAGSAVSTANGAVSTANSANSKSDSAVSTANTAKSTADTAKSTADAAKTSAASAVSTANSASSTATAAKSTADTAKSTADSAKAAAGSAQSTADTAVSNAAKAQSSADRAQGTADDAWARTLRVQVSSAPADAAGDTSRLTATVWRGGERLTEQEVAMMGLVAWYVAGKRVATGSTYTCAAGAAAECRVEA